MFESLRYSNLVLRLSLAAVFIWFGVDKFLHPEYWLNAWIPGSFLELAGKMGIGGNDIVYASGVFELLIGASLLTTIFIKTFSALAIAFLVVVMFTFGFNEVIVRDIGLIGGFLALILWPSRRMT